MPARQALSESHRSQICGAIPTRLDNICIATGTRHNRPSFEAATQFELPRGDLTTGAKIDNPWSNGGSNRDQSGRLDAIGNVWLSITRGWATLRERRNGRLSMLAAAETVVQNASIFSPASPPAQSIQNLSILIFAITGFIFVVVEGVLFYSIYPFSRGESRDGGPSGPDSGASASLRQRQSKSPGLPPRC